MIKQAHHIFALIMSAFIVFGCSDDEIIGTGISSLSLPHSINLLSTDINAQTNNVAINTVLTDPGTDFSTDTAIVFFRDSGSDESSSTNFRLCLLGKLKYAEKLNAGPYKVVANIESCIKTYFPEWAQSEKSTFVVEGTVNSTRTDNNSPHIIVAWLSYKYDLYQADTLYKLRSQVVLDISIFNNVSDEYPYGNFTVNSARVKDEGNSGDAVGVESRTNKATFKSFLENNITPVFKSADYSIQDSGNSVDFYATSIYLSAEHKDAGAMQTQFSSTYLPDPNLNNSETSLHRFDKNNLLRSRFKEPSEIIANQSCLSRNELYDEYVAYNLYHSIDGQFRGTTVSAGERVKLTSRLDFTYLGQYGSISDGFYWLENRAVLPDGAVITGNDDKLYTAHVVNGVLDETRHIPIALSALENRQLKYFGAHPTSGKSGSWILIVDTKNDFVITKAITSNQIGSTLSDTYDHDDDVTTPEVPVAATLTFVDGEPITFSDASYVHYQYVHDVNVAAIERSATYVTIRRINVGNTDLFSDTITSIKLYCYYTCPKGGLVQADVDSAAEISDLYHSYFTFNTAPVIYSLNSIGFKIQLVDDSNDLPVDVSNLDLTKFGQYPLIRGVKMTAMPLPVGATRTTLDRWDVTYAWRAGEVEDSHSRMVTLSNSANELVVFDEPIKLTYTFDAADDISNKDPNTNLLHGQKYNLTFIDDYLNGLPVINNSSGFHRLINLADGTVLSADEGSFVTRASMIARLLQEKPVSDCANISLDGLMEDEKLTLMTVDDIIEVPFTNADKPEVNSPTVISQ